MGQDCLKTVTSGGSNCGFGVDALANNTGSFNVAIGTGSMLNNTSASNNTAIGKDSLRANTTGTFNTALGRSCLESITTASSSTGVGYGALAACTSDENTAVGKHASVNVSTGQQNTSLGSQALYTATTGTQNTCLGRTAGYDGTTGSNNLLLGLDAGRSNSPGGTVNNESNVVVLGNNDIASFFCAETSISSSDSRDKTDITDFGIGLKWIEALRPVTYKWDKRTWYGTEEEPFGTPDGSKKKSKINIGFLAQEALAIEKANGYGTSNDDSLIVNLTPDGMSYGMKYERLVPILVNALKELSAKVTALEAG